MQFSSLSLRTDQENTKILVEVSCRFIEKDTLLILNFVWPHSLTLDIGQGFDDSYLGLGITHSQPFCNIIFVNIILLSFCMLSLYFLLALLRD